MLTGKVLGFITALLIVLIGGALLIILPNSGAVQLMHRAFHLGWPGALVIVGLLLYFQFFRKNDQNRSELVFKCVVGLLGYGMLFIAIANYAMNFNDESAGAPGEPRFLPISLVMFTVASFTMAMYFKGVRVLLQIGGFMFFVAACLAGFGNWPWERAGPKALLARGNVHCAMVFRRASSVSVRRTSLAFQPVRLNASRIPNTAKKIPASAIRCRRRRVRGAGRLRVLLNTLPNLTPARIAMWLPDSESKEPMTKKVRCRPFISHRSP